MDEDYQIFGCVVWLIVSLVAFVVVIIEGGSFRTEVTYAPSVTQVANRQVSFEENLKARHWVFGLIKGKQPDIQESLSKYMHSGDEITKLTVITKHTWIDNLVTCVTLFIYCPVTVTVRGTINQAAEFTP